MVASALCGRREGSERGKASGPWFVTPVPSSIAPGPASRVPSSPAPSSAIPGPASPALHLGWPDLGQAFGDGWMGADLGEGGLFLGRQGARHRQRTDHNTNAARDTRDNVPQLSDNSPSDMIEDDKEEGMEFDGGELDVNSV